MHFLCLTWKLNLIKDITELFITTIENNSYCCSTTQIAVDLHSWHLSNQNCSQITQLSVVYHRSIINSVRQWAHKAPWTKQIIFFTSLLWYTFAMNLSTLAFMHMWNWTYFFINMVSAVQLEVISKTFHAHQSLLKLLFPRLHCMQMTMTCCKDRWCSSELYILAYHTFHDDIYEAQLIFWLRLFYWINSHMSNKKRQMVIILAAWHINLFAAQVAQQKF